MTTTMQQQQQQQGDYLTAFFDIFVTPMISALDFVPPSFRVMNPNIRYIPDAKKCDMVNDLIFTIEVYQETSHQWMTDKDDNIIEELVCLLRDALLPIEVVPLCGRYKLYHDLMHLKNTLDELSSKLHCNEIDYFIKEMGKCTPNNATQYELLLKSGNINVYYNRLKRLGAQLAESNFDAGDEERDAQTAILTAYMNVEVVGDEKQTEIPEDRDEFLKMWQAKDFDNQLLLYPRQKMYRNMPYCKTEPDDWIYAHREQMKYMNGDVYWRKSPVYADIVSSVKFAFYNYPDSMKREMNVMGEMNMGGMDVMGEMDVMGDMEEINVSLIGDYPLMCNAPNNEFKVYYELTVGKFCECVDSSITNRTGRDLNNIYTMVSKIRAMTEWMKSGMDMFDYTLDLVVSPDMSNNLIKTYRDLIDYLLYEISRGINISITIKSAL